MAILLSGAMAGLAGAYFTLGSVGRFDEVMTSGKGFIGLAAMIFGNWTPIGSFLGWSAVWFCRYAGLQTANSGQTYVPPQIMAMLPILPPWSFWLASLGKVTLLLRMVTRTKKSNFNPIVASFKIKGLPPGGPFLCCLIWMR